MFWFTGCVLTLFSPSPRTPRGRGYQEMVSVYFYADDTLFSVSPSFLNRIRDPGSTRQIRCQPKRSDDKSSPLARSAAAAIDSGHKKAQ